MTTTTGIWIVRRRSLLGIPLILSANSRAQITLVDASAILYSDTGAIEIDLSEQAAVAMDGAPVPATALTSLWQLDLWGVRVPRRIAYQRAHSGSVAYMEVTY